MSIEAMKLAVETIRKLAQNNPLPVEDHDHIIKVLLDLLSAIEQAQSPCDMGKMCLGCTPRNADGSCPDAQKQEPVALKVYRGEICYKSQEDDQSFGMWCPVAQDCLPFAEGTKFYTSPPIK